MSLNFTIRSDKEYKSTGTGVFVRDSRGTRELQTLDEIKLYYPEIDFNNITPTYYKSYNVWSKDIISNVGYLASRVPVKNSTLYYYLWKPSEIGFVYVNEDYISGIHDAYEYLISRKEELKNYNSNNYYEDLLEFLKSLKDCLDNLIINYSDEFEIIATR